MKRPRLGTIALILLAAFVCISQGWPPGPLALWNLVPVILYYPALRYFRRRGIRGAAVKVSLAVFSLCLLGIPTAAHLAWAADFQATRTGSSTSALIFVFIPLYAIVLSIVPFLVALFFTRRNK
jgi:hypothetical protein